MKINEACVCTQAPSGEQYAGIAVPPAPGDSTFEWRRCPACPMRDVSTLTVGELRDLIRGIVKSALATRFPDLPPL